MALSLDDSGTQTAVISTEHTLSTRTSVGVFQLKVDVSALVAGDVLELRVYEKCLSGGTERQSKMSVYVNAQTDLMKETVPIASDISVKFTLKQTAGTGRSFPWKVLKF